MQNHGKFGLGLGLTYALIHEKFGFDMGEQYHLDIVYRVKITQEIDRAVHKAYGNIGIGYENPLPRITIEPFGHRFLPVMYGCECVYAKNAEAASRHCKLSRDQIMALQPWTLDRFENSDFVQTIISQTRSLTSKFGQIRLPFSPFNPHSRLLSSLQNLGSVINTAFSIQGEDILVDCLVDSDVVKKLYHNITELTLLCLDYFPKLDGIPLKDVFVGNCTVSMISPQQYMNVNYPFDRKLMDYSRSIGANFMMHQDSDVTPHLENYARFEYLQALDVGQDTDFEKMLKLFPDAAVNCILFPSWVQNHSLEEICEELSRLMQIGKSFRSFTFTLFEVDQELGDRKIFEFHEAFKRCAADAST